MSRSDWTRVGGYGAAALCVVYGSMKLAQALGANALADKDPLPPELHERLVARDPLFVASHWMFVCVAVVGVVVALATVRPWGAAVPRRLLLGITWAAGIFMIARSFGVPGFGFVADALKLAGVVEVPAEHAALARERTCCCGRRCSCSGGRAGRRPRCGSAGFDRPRPPKPSGGLVRPRQGPCWVG
ncbi:DUF3995 domain-containing protein [Microtetraspora malaysiensis]|uniref:DUF3995 domain-containing protein n=1 Tax=Microtetraspora malaysiensis TaxID=161358 RepID=UPI003D91597F